MKGKLLMVLICGGVALGVLLARGGSEEQSHKLTTISPRKLADALHAVIAADRQAYSELIVQRLHADEHLLPATENWQAAHGLPVPAQMFQKAAQAIQRAGAEFSYSLRSRWPINENNGPQTQVEETGLEYVVRHPGENYYAEEMLGGRSYFTAVYADRASLPSCIECHNRHPQSPRRDFKLDDVMGGIVVRVPLEF